MTDHPGVPQEIVDRLRAICADLPEAHEEPAWVGIRWRIKTKTFAHLVAIAGGWPPAYADAAGTPGPATVLTFRSSGDDLQALATIGPPFFKPVWFRDILGLVFGPATDWEEVAELVTDSYILLAPKGLAALVEQRSRMTDT